MIRVTFPACLVLLGLMAATRPARAAPPPNILLIVSDDQCYRDFGFMGNASVHTPNLDRLAGSAARFVNGYVPSSVCSPSLATLLTGLYPHQHHIHYNHPPPGNAAFNRMTSRAEYERVRSRSFSRIRELDTLPRLLADAGYRCLQTGKFWEGHFSNAGFTDGMTVFRPVPGQDFGGNRTLANGALAAHGNGDRGLRIGRKTMEPIDTFLADSGDTPWFIWYAPYLPHEPHETPQRFVELAKSKPGVRPHQLPYYASIAWFDHTVGQLLAMLRHHRDEDNTLIVFVTDNGWTPQSEPDKRGNYRPIRRSKRSPFEDGLRTPILIGGASLAGDPIEPQTSRNLVSTIDLVPTILRAAGVDVPENLPGRSLLAAARAQANLESLPVFGEIYPGDASTLGEPERHIAYRWVRDGSLKLIVPHRHNDQPPWRRYLDHPALFNLETDPREQTNLIDHPAHQAEATRLRALLDDWWIPN